MNFSRLIGAVSFLLAFAVVGSQFENVARAQDGGDGDAPADDSLEATPKGTIGLGLIGAELGLVLPALAGLDETWSMILFPVVGGAGGAVAGYFLLDDPDHTEVAVASLAVGMALIVPSVVLTVALTAYDPESDFEDDARASETGLLRIDGQRGLSLGMPALTVGTIHTQDEIQQFGVSQRTELDVPVLSGRF